MEKYLFELDPSVIEMFQADKLKIVGTHFYASFQGKWNESLSESPATFLFDGIKYVEPTEGGWILNGSAFLESTDQGINYRFYNNVDRSKATVIYQLVIGNPQIDICYFNPGVRLTSMNDGKTVLIENISVINGYEWEDAPMNREFKSYGLTYFITGIRDGEYGSLSTIADYYNGNRVEDWNRGSGREGFVKLSIDPKALFDMNVENDDRYDETIADYIFSQEDIDDPDVEGFTMVTYVGLKDQEVGKLRFTIDELFDLEKHKL